MILVPTFVSPICAPITNREVFFFFFGRIDIKVCRKSIMENLFFSPIFLCFPFACLNVQGHVTSLLGMKTQCYART